jgi:hypothetical protein
MLRQAGDEPDGATNVSSLWPDGIAATPDYIVNGICIDARPRDQRFDGMRAKVGRMQRGKAALLPANGGANSVDDIGFGHVSP